MGFNSRLVAGRIGIIATMICLAGCSSPGSTPNAAAPGAPGDSFTGTVTRVREDSMVVDVEGVGSMRFDTWEACGDNTARNVSVGDQVTVSANRDGLEFEAREILDSDGQSLCTGTPGTQADAAAPDATGNSFTGTVSRVREDSMTVDVADGGSMRFDTWAVCGDNTARSISVGDQVTVYADRDGVDFEAWRILDTDGQPLCTNTTPE